ncbi:FdhF/YdeP family oxidoreductase [Sphingomonas sp. DT-51]|uniref:FdhF/YdeP family oxidoreductase n=1 Tax=Sphingomonas sp. DT-51 TaxID=3396165 RepID=UPI003F1CE0EC
MTEKRPDGIRAYDEPAGGWGALKAVATTLKRQQLSIAGPATLLHANQPTGFDCPGCAWPDPKHTSSFEFCENGAKAISWESTARRAGSEVFAENTISDLWEKTDHWLEMQGRLTQPLRYDQASDRFVPVTWEDAFEDIGQHLRRLDQADQAEFYTSGRASNEAAFLYQLFVRRYGTNNFPDCSNMCHEPTSVGLPQAIGVGKGTVTLDDFDEADFILSIGHNPGTNHPRMMTSLHDASKRGARIVVVNPFRERALERFEAPQAPVEMATMTSVPIASSYLQVRIGGDAAALKGICKSLVEMDEAAVAAGLPAVLDHAFIAGHTAGFEALRDDLRTSTWDAIEKASGLTRGQLEGVAREYAAAERAIVCYGMGITQHRTGTANVQQITNLLLLRGNIGRPGAGVCPLRGHSNVQGDRTVGITERPSPEFLDRLGTAFGFDPPRRAGHSVVESIAAMRDGRSKAVICLGGNLAVAAPDPQACHQAFRSVDLAVHIATKLNRTHLLTARSATYILPCLGRTDLDVQASGPQTVTVEDSMSMVHGSRGFLNPPSPDLRSEPAIVAGIAKTALEGGGGIDWDAMIADYAVIRDRIEAVFPDFQAFNERVRKPGGFRLPNAAAERVWKTATGKANFMIFPGLEEDMVSSDPAVLRLASMRSHDQYNTTVYGMDDRYRGVFGRRDVLFVGERDLDRLGLADGDSVDVETAFDDGEGVRVVAGLTAVRYDLPEGSCGAYYPECQALIALGHHDPASLTPSYKSVPVRVRRAASSVARPGVFERPAQPTEA